MSRRAFPYLWLPLAGFALGWWLRGTPANRVEGPNEAGATSGAARTFGLDEEQAAPAKRFQRQREEEAFTESDRRREAADRERMLATCRRKLELQIAEWQRELDLSDAEAAGLREAIGPAVGKAEPPVAELALPFLVEVLEGMLSGDRAAAFAELAARKEEARLEARVDSKLADMGAVLILSPAQKDALRQVLGSRADRLPEPGGAAGGLPPEARAEISSRLVARNDDGSGFMAIAGEVLRERIEAELEPLGGILSADQLETYRGHLEESHAAWLLRSP